MLPGFSVAASAIRLGAAPPVNRAQLDDVGKQLQGLQIEAHLLLA